MTGIFKNVSATSEAFLQFSEDFWMLLKTSEDVPTTSEHFSSYLKDNNFSVFWLS